MIPTRVGQRFRGGSFAGVIREGNVCYALIVAPECTETTGIPFKTSDTATTETQSVNNGQTNTSSMNDATHPVAQYCLALTEGGYTDWYLPSRDELELCYRYLKPTTDNNATGLITSTAGNLNKNHGKNPNSVPVGDLYKSANPSQTAVIAFRTGEVEAFNTDRYYWTSTEYSASTFRVLVQCFISGYQGWSIKLNPHHRVRAVRRVAI